MTDWKSADAVLDYAIAREMEAERFYMDLTAKMTKPWMADMFKTFALQERGHKAKLEAVKTGRMLVPAEGKVLDLKIADYTVDVPPDPNMNFQDALILAMKREKAAFKLYTDLAAAAGSDELRQTFEALAQEEAGTSSRSKSNTTTAF